MDEWLMNWPVNNPFNAGRVSLLDDFNAWWAEVYDALAVLAGATASRR